MEAMEPVVGVEVVEVVDVMEPTRTTLPPPVTLPPGLVPCRFGHRRMRLEETDPTVCVSYRDSFVCVLKSHKAWVGE